MKSGIKNYHLREPTLRRLEFLEVQNKYLQEERDRLAKEAVLPKLESMAYKQVAERAINKLSQHDYGTAQELKRILEAQ